jgi:predicted nucleic acid-binding protein
MASVGSADNPIVFVDTHVLLSADDAHDATKQARARSWLQALWLQRAGRVSTQVLNDYYVIATQTYAMLPGDARAKLRRFQLWQPWQIDHQTVETAWGVEARFGLRYWDALMVASAAQSGANYVLTPSLAHQLHIDGVTILDPFQTTPADLGITD